MVHIFDIVQKDLTQILRDRKTFLFLLFMPIAFTVFFAFAFGSVYKGPADNRVSVAYLDEDNSPISQELHGLLQASTLIRLDEKTDRTAAEMDQLVADGDLAAAVIIPAGYGQSLLDGSPMQITFISDPSQTASMTIQGDVQSMTSRLVSAVQIANIASSQLGDPSIFDATLKDALLAWQDPPIRMEVTSAAAVKTSDPNAMSAAHSSPGMMLQFAIAGLITAATVIVNERKSRSLQRLLTTATSRVHILMGHYLAIFSLIFTQFVILIAFGQLLLKVDYMRVPLATLLVAVTCAACISALGLLIGVFAKSEEHTVVLTLIPMFILSGLGGAWMPLEFTGATFRSIGHVSPIAWAMDGFKNIVARGLDFNSVLLPVAALLGYTILFLTLAVLRFRRVSE
jgi:ABC-2 type transport system permease protein